MPNWQHWQNERGVLTGTYHYRDSSAATNPEREQNATGAHHGSFRLRSTSERGLTDTVMDTLGASGKWSMMFTYKLNAFPANNDILFNITTSGNVNLVRLNTPASSTVSAQVRIGSNDGLTVNLYNWDLTGVFYTPDTDSRQRWMHLVMTYDSSLAAADEMTFYTYGVETIPTSTTIAGSTNQDDQLRSVQIGSVLGIGSVALIHEVAFWENKILDANAVKTLYNQMRPFDLQRDTDGYDGAAQLVNWWKLSEKGTEGVLWEDSLNADLNLLDAGNVAENNNAFNHSPSSSFIEFNGTDELFLNDNGGSGQVIGVADDFTVSIWANTGSGTLIDIDDVTTSGENRIRLETSTDITGHFNDGNTEGTATATSYGGQKNWRHILLTRASGGELNLYIDSELVGSTSGDTGKILTDPGTRAVAIGANIDSTNFFDGSIQNVAVWSTAMTTDDVAVIFNEGSSDLDLRRSFKGYRHACSLQHWWWCSQPAMSTEEGNDFIVDKGHGSTLIDMSADAAGIGRANIINEPDIVSGIGSGACTGTCLIMDGNTELLSTSSAIDLGIADNWTITVACRSRNIGTQGIGNIFEAVGNDHNRNRIRIRVVGTVANDPLDIALWNSAGGLIKVFRYNSIFVDGEWRVITVQWQGAVNLLQTWVNGELLTASSLLVNSSGTMDNTDLRIVSIDAATSGFDGTIASAAVWSGVSVSREDSRIINQKQPKLDFRASDSNIGYSFGSLLEHWWKLGTETGTLGKDFVESGAEDLDTVTGIDEADNLISEGY